MRQAMQGGMKAEAKMPSSAFQLELHGSFCMAYVPSDLAMAAMASLVTEPDRSGSRDWQTPRTDTANSGLPNLS